ncbi:lysostaphin resistance A-like protein [Sphingobacterium sp. SG20118]|uniref:CPBP family intramembrane glutamic endopeptidase n=1 Tax=Sphingobacterium sp. SG20118 TaxID=3367156 RepID=UPI0037DFC789
MEKNTSYKNELKPFFSNLFDLNWKFGIFLILIICIPRFILVLNANATANYGYIGLIMILSALVPFIFLNKHGRREIGLTKPKKYKWLLLAFISGLFASIVLYAMGYFLYGNSYENWYQYIAKSYNIPEGINHGDKTILFIIMAITGMIFSPIGEELFFRGIVHESFSKSFGDRKASIIDASAFAITHISHFGLVFLNNKWHFYTVPTIIWVLSMFIVSLLFFHFRKRSGSILGAVICHAAFNLGMIFCIFYLL